MESSHSSPLGGPSAGRLLDLLLLGSACTGGTGDTEATATSATTGSSGASMSSTSLGTSAGSTSETSDATSTSSTTSTSSATSTTRGTTLDPTDPTETDTGCNFLCEDFGCGAIAGLDGAPRCLPSCDLWAQDCPEGEKCNAWSDDGGPTWNATRCTPVGVDPIGAPCTVEDSIYSGADSCVFGAQCVDVDEESGVGVCVGVCGGTPDDPTCADPGTGCAKIDEGALNLCLPTCDPQLQDCAPDHHCVDIGDGFFCVGDAAAPAGYAEACLRPADCAAELTCLDEDLVPECMGIRCCTPYCAVSEPNTCPGMPLQSCVPWYEPGQAPVGFEDLGVCAAI